MPTVHVFIDLSKKKLKLNIRTKMLNISTVSAAYVRLSIKLYVQCVCVCVCSFVVECFRMFPLIIHPKNILQHVLKKVIVSNLKIIFRIINSKVIVLKNCTRYHRVNSIHFVFIVNCIVKNYRSFPLFFFAYLK